MRVVIETRGLCVEHLVLRHGMRSIKHFIVSFGGVRLLERKRVLHGVDLAVHRGECFGIVGRNGSGKSTLLRTFAGILSPVAGSLRVEGRVAPMLALGAGLEPELDGRENVRLCAALMGYDRTRTRSVMEHVRAFSGLTDEDLGMPVKRYSTGMSARLSFSIATAGTPDVLLIDEVLAVGDAGFQEKCYARIAELKAAGCTIVLVSHALAEVQRLCDRAACMEGGRVVEVGDPHTVGLHYHRLLGIEA